MSRLLAKYRREREDLARTVRALQDRAATEDRDLTEAEEAAAADAVEAIRNVDAKIAPLEDVDKLLREHEGAIGGLESAAAGAAADRSEDGGGRLTIRTRPLPEYRSAGEFVRDLVRAMPRTEPGLEGVYDPGAAARMSAYLSRDTETPITQTTADTPGLLPETVVGSIFDTMETARPLITSVGAKDLGSVPGKKFHRPTVTARTAPGTGIQSAELAEVDRAKVTIGSVEFAKESFSRYVPVSLQEIDWTSPGAWDLILAGFLAIYAEDTERWAETALSTAVTASETVATDDYEGWVHALYAARTKVVTDNGNALSSALRAPDTLYVSTDMESSLGAMIEIHRGKFVNAIGTSDVRTGGGGLLSLPRIELPHLDEGTVILGRKVAWEFYEQRKGFLQAVSPKHMGVEIGYGGYAATGAMDASMFCKLTTEPAEPVVPEG